MNSIHKIKNLRNERKLSQEEMADKLGIEQNTYSRIESGKSKLKLDMAMLIANIFDMPLSEIINDELLSIHIEDNNVETGAQQFIQNIVNTINVEHKEMNEFLKIQINKQDDLLKEQSGQISKLIKIVETK